MSNRWVWVLLGLIAVTGCKKGKAESDADVGDAGGVDGIVGAAGRDGGSPGAGGAAGATGGRGGAAGASGASGAAGAGGRGGGAGTAVAGSGGAAGAGGAAGGAGTAVACNAIADDTPAIRENMGGGALPAFTGGTIPDGTYVLVERYDFVSSCNCLVHGKMVVSRGGQTIRTLLRTEPAAAERQSGTMSISGNAMNWDFTCPTTTTVQHLFNVLTGAGGIVALQTYDGNLQYETWLSGSCNTIDNTGAAIAEMRVAQAMPTSTGGTLVDGTYRLSRREIFTGPGGESGPTGDTRKATLVITNAATPTMTLDYATAVDGSGDYRERYSGVTPSGAATNFGVTRSCPPTPVISVSAFSASGNTLVLVNENNGQADTWTRQ